MSDCVGYRVRPAGHILKEGGCRWKDPVDSCPETSRMVLAPSSLRSGSQALTVGRGCVYAIARTIIT